LGISISDVNHHTGFGSHDLQPDAAFKFRGLNGQQ